MTSLHQRLEDATEGTRELDLWLHGAVNGNPGKLVGTSADVPPYTTSLDAALALAERLNPGGGWEALYSGLMNWRAHTPEGLKRIPLCVCISILTAAQKETTT